MSMETSDIAIITPTAQTSGSYLEWSPIFGGAVLSAAITTVMAAFGSALGLSLVSADTTRTSSMTALTIAIGLWTIWITVSACSAGGYLAGRMRRPAPNASDHERSVRDGAHGLVVWAVGVLIVSMIASSSLFGAAKTAVTAGAAASGGAAALISQQADPLGSALDSVMRSTGTTPSTADEREQASRIFLAGISSGKLDPGDRDYVASRLAVRMNIAEPEAQKRVDDAFAKLQQAKETAKQTAERTRKIAVITAFLTAAVLLLGAAAAWLSAQLGGQHRDEDMDLEPLSARH